MAAVEGGGGSHSFPLPIILPVVATHQSCRFAWHLLWQELQADEGQKTSASGPSEPDQPAAAVPGLEKG